MEKSIKTMRLFGIDMEYITDSLKVVGALLLAWFTDIFYISSINFLFIGFPTIKEYLLDLKDIMSFIITFMVMIITFLKMKKYLKRK